MVLLLLGKVCCLVIMASGSMVRFQASTATLKGYMGLPQLMLRTAKKSSRYLSLYREKVIDSRILVPPTPQFSSG